MTKGRRFIWVLTLLAFIVLSSGCAGTSLRPVEDEIARKGTGINKEKGQSVRGYLLDDDTMIEYKGKVRITGQDSLAFWSKGYSDEVSFRGAKKEIKIPGPVFPISSIKSLDVWESNSLGSALLVFAAIIVVDILIFVAQGGDVWED